MTDKKDEGISLSHYFTRPKWERDLNKQNPWHNQSVIDSRIFDELKRGTLPQALHDAFLDHIHERMEKQASAQIKRAEAPRRDATLSSIIETLATHPGTAKQLWPKLFGMLDVNNMEPEENGLTYRYRDADDRPKTIAFKTFQNELGEARKKL